MRELKDSDAAILLLIYSTALGAEWTVWWSGGGRRGTAVPSHAPRPNHAGRKKTKFFFSGASPLNAQRSPDFGHENGIIYILKKKSCNQVTRWWCGSVYNVVDDSIPQKNFVSRLIECITSYNIRSHTFYEFNGLNI